MKNGKAHMLPAIFRTPEMEAQALLDDAINVVAQDLAHNITNLPFTVGKGMMIPMPLCRAAAEKIVNRFSGAVLAGLKGEAAIAALANEGWFPIETAPQDGAPVDLWIGREENPYRATDFYFEDGHWVRKEGHPAVWRRLLVQPTHWRPRPAPPIDATAPASAP